MKCSQNTVARLTSNELLLNVGMRGIVNMKTRVLFICQWNDEEIVMNYSGGKLIARVNFDIPFTVFVIVDD